MIKKYVKPIVMLEEIASTTILDGSNLQVTDKETNEMLSKRGFFFDLDTDEEE